SHPAQQEQTPDPFPGAEDVPELLGQPHVSGSPIPALNRNAYMRRGIAMQCITPLIIRDGRWSEWMGTERSFYFGNAAVDQVRGTGWFVGQFVPPEMGLRHQTDLELKWAIHPDGDRR